MAAVGDEDCAEDCDELDHLDEALTKSSSSFKTMFNKGVKYQSYLNRVVETKSSGGSRIKFLGGH